MSKYQGKASQFADERAIVDRIERLENVNRSGLSGGGSGGVGQEAIDAHAAVVRGVHGIPAAFANARVPVYNAGTDSWDEFDPSLKAAVTDARFPTASEKAAIAGASGTAVSSANKLLDQGLFDAKGDLIVGTGSDTHVRLPVGPNGTTLVADSSQASGFRYDIPAAITAAYDTTKIGTVQAWTSNTIPSDMVLAAGQTLNEVDYPQLCAHAATEVAAGNALWSVAGTAPTRTFTVPNLQDRFIYGKGANALGTVGGATSHVLSINEMPSHDHPPGPGGFTAFAGSGPAGFGGVAGSGLNNTMATTGTRGGGVAHNNMPPYVVLAWVIKAKGVTIINPTTIQGPQGIQGIQGPQGNTGPTGPAGDASVLAFKSRVKVATVANVALSGLGNIDGVALVAGDRILVKNQTTASQNGIYTVSSGSWTRATDADTSAKFDTGQYVGVDQGTTQQDSLWQLTTNSPITLGTTALAYERYAGRSEPWIVLPAGSWSNTDAVNYSTGAYRKGADGRVYLRGIITTSAGTGAFSTLPVGYRPGTVLWFTIVYYNGSAYVAGLLKITTAGQMTSFNSAGSPVSLNSMLLDGISFFTD